MIDNDRKPTLPIILSLSVDEATAKKIASVDKLQDILNGNENRPGAFEVRSGNINNGNNDGFSRSDVGDELLALELLLHPDETTNNRAAAARDGHRMLRGRRLSFKSDWDLAFGWFSNNKRTPPQARPVPIEAKQPNSSLTNKLTLAPITLSKSLPWGKWVLQRFHYKENEIHSDNKNDGDSIFFYANDYPNRQRRRTLSAKVNDAFHDSEDVLLVLLEDTICGMIEKAFPGFLPEEAEQRCRLEYSKGMFHSGISAANNFLVGSDRDGHGCIPSAGYSWCQTLKKCHRPWETRCEVIVGGDNYAIETPLLGDDRDQHGCHRSAGYSWCDASKSCHKSWETACGDSENYGINNGNTIEEPLLGDDRDEHGCHRSAGFSWCDASKSCHKPWETACDENDRRQHGTPSS